MCEAAGPSSSKYTEEEKDAAAFLRERFLFLVASLPGIDFVLFGCRFECNLINFSQNLQNKHVQQN